MQADSECEALERGLCDEEDKALRDFYRKEHENMLNETKSMLAEVNNPVFSCPPQSFTGRREPNV